MALLNRLGPTYSVSQSKLSHYNLFLLFEILTNCHL